MASIEKSTQQVTKLYRKAARDIQAELKEGISDPRGARLQSISAQIDAILRVLENTTGEIIPPIVRLHYNDGFTTAANAIRAAGLPISGGFSQIDEEAIQAIASDMFLSFGEAMRGAKRSSGRIISEIRKKQIQEAFASGRITGQTRREITQDLIEILRKDFVALKDKRGRNWTLQRYAETVTRTKIVETTNTGLTNRLLRDGYELVQVSDHNSDHDECSVWENKILSILPGHKKYKSVDYARKRGLFHPNCKHRLLPYHPEIAES